MAVSGMSAGAAYMEEPVRRDGGRSNSSALPLSFEVCDEPREVAGEFPSEIQRVQSAEHGFEESSRLNHEVDPCSILVYGFELMIKGDYWSNAAPPSPLPVPSGVKLDHGQPGGETLLRLQHTVRRCGYRARWITLDVPYVSSPCLGPLLGRGEVVPRHLQRSIDDYASPKSLVHRGIMLLQLTGFKSACSACRTADGGSDEAVPYRDRRLVQRTRITAGVVIVSSNPTLN